MQDRTLIVSASSDIGYHLAKHWMNRGRFVIGTYRTSSEKVSELEGLGARLLHCDLGVPNSVESIVEQVSDGPVDRLVLAAGLQNPIGLFGEVDFDEWADSINTNFVAQVRLLHGLLSRGLLGGSRVLMFAGGGTNNATQRYSAYTIAKIASIKATELFASEYPQTCFSILGPGWVRTKIHQQTLQNPSGAGENFGRTLQHLEDNDFFPMERLLQCIDWIFEEETSVVTGRNFSAVHDKWGSQSLSESLANDNDLYKLRRHGNSLAL